MEHSLRIRRSGQKGFECLQAATHLGTAWAGPQALCPLAGSSSVTAMKLSLASAKLMQHDPIAIHSHDNRVVSGTDRAHSSHDGKLQAGTQ